MTDSVVDNRHQYKDMVWHPGYLINTPKTKAWAQTVQNNYDYEESRRAYTVARELVYIYITPEMCMHQVRLHNEKVIEALFTDSESSEVVSDVCYTNI